MIMWHMTVYTMHYIPERSVHQLYTLKTIIIVILLVMESLKCSERERERERDGDTCRVKSQTISEYFRPGIYIGIQIILACPLLCRSLI